MITRATTWRLGMWPAHAVVLSLRASSRTAHRAGSGCHLALQPLSIVEPYRLMVATSIVAG